MTQTAESQAQRLFNFIGYGQLDAPVWFLGMEERGSSKTIGARLKFKQVEDLRDAHIKMGIIEHHRGKKIIQPTWRGMCYVMLVYDGKKPTTERIRKYQVNKLGRSNGKTLLTELLPMPKKKVTEWRYETNSLPFKNLKEYHSNIIDDRIERIRRIFKQHAPKIVICYGKTFWENYRNIFAEVDFTPDSDGLFEYADIGHTKIILSYHFTHPKMNKGIAKLARIVRKHKKDF